MASIPVSTIPVFKAALQAQLAADASISAAAIPVLYGMPALGQAGQIGREFILLGWTRDEDPTNGPGNFRGGWSTAALGSTRHVEERYVLEAAVVRIGPGLDGQQAVTERAFAIFQYVSAALTNWGEVGGFTGLPARTMRWAFICGLRHEEGRVDQDFRTIINFDIACSARLTGAGSP